MRKIEAYNAGATICSERICDKKAEYFDVVDYCGLKVTVILCKRHADEATKAR